MHLKRLYIHVPKKKEEAEPLNFHIEHCLPEKIHPLFSSMILSRSVLFFNFGEQNFSGKSYFTLIFHPRLECGEYTCLCSLPQMLTGAVWPPAYKAALQFTWNFLQDHPEAAAGAEYLGACLHENVSWRSGHYLLSAVSQILDSCGKIWCVI